MSNEQKAKSLIRQVANGTAQGLRVYFVGIGGIGMSAIARYFNSKGVVVSGYDRTETPLTRQLEDEGMRIHYDDEPGKADREASLVVYTPAIPAEHRELGFYRQQGYPVHKRSEVLGWITESSFNICVAGTHGKTTTSSLVAHLLRHSGYGANAFLGGIVSGYDTNFWGSDRNVTVLEADEYDRSFLQLRPDLAIITAMDPDHLDIYGSAAAFTEAFLEFSGKVKEGGWLVYRKGLEQEGGFRCPQGISYSADDSTADAYAYDIRSEDGINRFSVSLKGHRITDMTLPMGGRHNVENAVAALTVAHQLGITDEALRHALAEFRGVKRRFEYVRREDHRVLIDDYAHHPRELTALIRGARELFPGRSCTVIFQPHLYTRTRDFAEGFAAALDLADETLLLPIYPARETPIAGVDSQMVAAMMKGPVTCLEKNELLDQVKARLQRPEPGIFLMAGAGDIDQWVQPVALVLDAN